MKVINKTWTMLHFILETIEVRFQSSGEMEKKIRLEFDCPAMEVVQLLEKIAISNSSKSRQKLTSIWRKYINGKEVRTQPSWYLTRNRADKLSRVIRECHIREVFGKKR